MENKKKWIIGLIFVGLAFIACCMFPFLNLTKEQPLKMETTMINWLIIVVSIMFYYSMGKYEANVFSEKPLVFVVLFNLVATIVGMASRFLIEFGEISNVYNFTLPNTILQLLVAVVLTSGTWFFWARFANKK